MKKKKASVAKRKPAKRPVKPKKTKETSLIPQGKADKNLWALMEKVVIGGDLKDLTSEERVLYYHNTCESLGLNPLTKPFEYIVLDNKLILYARATAADQLRKINNISITKVELSRDDDLITARAYGEQPSGRKDTASAVIPMERWDKYKNAMVRLTGVDLANAIMKCETKCKRRLTLSMAGLNMVEESDLDTLKGLEYAHLNAIGDIVSIEPVSQPGETEDSFVKYAEQYETLFAFTDDKVSLGDLREIFRRAQRAGWSKDKITGVCLTFDWDAEKILNLLGNKLEEAAAAKASKVAT